MSKELPVFEEWPFKVPSIKAAVKKYGEFTAQIKVAASGEEVVKIIKKANKYNDAIGNEFTHVQVLFSLDTKNPKYVKAQTKLNNEGPYLSAATQEFNKAILSSPHKDFVAKAFGDFYIQMMENSLKEFDEKIIPELQKESDLTMKYDALIASAQVPFRGGTYNLPQMGKFLQDLDRNTRKEASKAYYGYLATIQDQIEDIYDQLVKVRTEMAHKLGYKSYVELGYIRMSRYDYTPEMVASYREQIREVVTPIAAKIMKEQFKRTHIRKPEVYDMALAFVDGNPLPLGTTAEKIEKAKQMYNELSPETSYFFSYMADHHVLDLEARPGKQSGGYMTYFPKYKIPFIFSNFNGTSGDVDVLTHEFGHSFQAYMSRGIKVPEYRSPTMEACEIHSMSMEFLAEPWMNLFFDKPVRYRYTHLADSISFLPYGVTVDEFQHWVYENPDASKEERNAKWHELELKYTPYKVACYGDCQFMAEGRRWLLQGHIFACPFYYIDYTLAQVMAFQFFNLDRKNHALAWKRYLKLCKMGGKYPFVTLVKKDGMKSPFDPGVVKKTISPLVKVLKSYSLD